MAQAAHDGDRRPGKPIKSMKNLRTLLEHDPKLKGKLRLNLFSGRIDLVGGAPWKRPSGSVTWNDRGCSPAEDLSGALFREAGKERCAGCGGRCGQRSGVSPGAGLSERAELGRCAQVGPAAGGLLRGGGLPIYPGGDPEGLCGGGWPGP